MKILRTSILGASCGLLAAVALPAHAMPVYINDNPNLGGSPTTDYYMGADDQNLGDRIGSEALYEISGMNVIRNGNILTVSISTTFADNVGSNPGTTPGTEGIGFGDLFMAEDWNPFPTGGEPYQGDNHVTGTKWLYGFSLDDRWSTLTDGSSLGGTLYSLNGLTNDINAQLSDDFLNPSAIFRNGQEVAVDTSSDNINDGTIAAITGNSSWSVNGSGLTVDFSIDLTNTIFEGSDKTIALHWGMTCANDTIEGETPILPSAIPIPATV